MKNNKVGKDIEGKCKHESISSTHVHYSNGESLCEFTNKCSDCGEVINYFTDTYQFAPVVV